jgi:hypothetical protein
MIRDTYLTEQAKTFQRPQCREDCLSVQATRLEPIQANRSLPFVDTVMPAEDLWVAEDSTIHSDGVSSGRISSTRTFGVWKLLGHTHSALPILQINRLTGFKPG